MEYCHQEIMRSVEKRNANVSWLENLLSSFTLNVFQFFNWKFSPLLKCLALLSYP